MTAVLGTLNLGSQLEVLTFRSSMSALGLDPIEFEERVYAHNIDYAQTREDAGLPLENVTLQYLVGTTLHELVERPLA